MKSSDSDTEPTVFEKKAAFDLAFGRLQAWDGEEDEKKGFCTRKVGLAAIAIAIVLLIVIAAVIVIVIFATGSAEDETSFAWSYWSSWSSCRNSSLTSRTRFCVSGSTSDSDDERESADCPGADRETKECGACPASHPYTYGLGEMCCIGFYENLNDIESQFICTGSSLLISNGTGCCYGAVECQDPPCREDDSPLLSCGPDDSFTCPRGTPEISGCILPFKYQGQVYCECISTGFSQFFLGSWCATSVDYYCNHVGHSYSNCD